MRSPYNIDFEGGKLRRGDKVLCVDGAFVNKCTLPFDINRVPNRPAKGQTYTVRDIVIVKGKTGIRLEEIKNPETVLERESGKMIEPIFSIDRFTKSK